jgi:hypothetical protein
MVDNKLLASKGQVMVKTLTAEAWAWVSELPFAQKGETLGEVMTGVFERITALEDKTVALNKHIDEQNLLIESQANEIISLQNDVRNLKGLKVEI